MTTIAYKDGVIAYDSRSSSRGVILDDNCDKLLIRENEEKIFRFFISGSVSDAELFVNCYFDPSFKLHYLADVHAIVLEYHKLDRKYKLFTSSVNYEDDKFNIWKSPERFDNHISIGSGCNFALAFMDTGMSAIEAVKATMNRDMCTGGNIRNFDFSLNDKTL